MPTQIRQLAPTLALLIALPLTVVACGGGGGRKSRPPMNLTYADTGPTYGLCGEITPNAPTHSGGAVTAYAIDPALPAGLSFDTTTGVISGAPSALSTPTVYTVTASNAVGFATTQITIEVDHELPAGLSYPDLGAELAKGIYVEVAPLLAAGYGSTWSVSAGALPAGLALDPSTGVISGVPSTLGATSFSITVEDCAAATTFDAFSAQIVPPYTRGAALADAGLGVVRSFARAPSTGALLHNNKQWTQAGTSQVVVHPWTRFVFSASGGTIRSLGIHSRTLELSDTGNSVSIGAAAITDLACSNDGRFLFATSVLGVAHSFAIDTNLGELTPTPVATALTGTTPRRIVIDATDSWMFVADQDGGTISAFAIDPLTGSLTALGATPSGAGVRELALSSDNARLYAACAGASAIYGYDVDALTGALTPLGWSPKSIGTSGASGLALRPDDSVLYLAFDASTTVRAFELDALTGEPTDALFPNVDALSSARQLVLEPRGEHLYSVHAEGHVQIWTIALDGQLSPSSVGVTRAGAQASELALVFGHGDWRPSTRSVYATSLATDGAWEYQFNNTSGALTAIAGTPVATGINPQTVSVHPFVDRAVIAHQSPGTQRALTLHRIDDDGALGAGTGFGASTNNVGFEFERSGEFGYMVRNSGANSAVLTSYAFEASTGAIDPLGSVSFTASAWPPAVHPSGALLVVPDSGAEQLDIFALNPQTGLATNAGSVSTGGIDPFRAVFDPTGRFVFVAHIGSNSVAVFSVDVAAATLTPLAGSPFATAVTPLVMAISTGGSDLMIANTATGAWAYYTIDQDPDSPAVDGTLSLAGTGNQPGMALIRFSAQDSHLLWVLSGSNRIRSSPITAPGVLGAPVSDLAIGAQITSMALRNR